MSPRYVECDNDASGMRAKQNCSSLSFPHRTPINSTTSSDSEPKKRKTKISEDAHQKNEITAEAILAFKDMLDKVFTSDPSLVHDLAKSVLFSHHQENSKKRIEEQTAVAASSADASAATLRSEAIAVVTATDETGSTPDNKTSETAGVDANNADVGGFVADIRSAGEANACYAAGGLGNVTPFRDDDGDDDNEINIGYLLNDPLLMELNELPDLNCEGIESVHNQEPRSTKKFITPNEFDPKTSADDATRDKSFAASVTVSTPSATAAGDKQGQAIDRESRDMAARPCQPPCKEFLPLPRHHGKLPPGQHQPSSSPPSDFGPPCSAPYCPRCFFYIPWCNGPPGHHQPPPPVPVQHGVA